MSVVLGLPKKFLPQPEASLSEGVTSQWVKVQPNNVSSITSNSFNITASTTLTQPPNVVQDIRFSIPTAQGKNVWLDTSKSTFSFRARYQVTTATVGAFDCSGVLQSNCLAFYDRMQVLNSNGVAIDDVVGLGQIEHHKQVWGMDIAERDSVALNYGYLSELADVNRAQGHQIASFSSTGAAVPIGSSYYSYDVPLPSSFLGAGSKGFVPIGALQKLDIVLTTSNILPISIIAGAFTTSGIGNVVLDNFAINLYYVTLDDKSSGLLGSPKMHYVHGITNRASNATLQSGISGQTSVLMGIRGQSVRSIATRFSESALTTAGSLNGVFDSKLLLTSQLDYFLNGSQRFPQNPLSTNTQPASVFLHALQASEAFTQKEFRYAGIPSNFCTYLATGTAPTSANGYDQNIVTAGSTTGQFNLSNFTFATDLRRCSTSTILDGFNMSASANNYLELNITNSTTNNVYLTFIASLDIIYMIDMEQGTVDFRM